MKCEKSNRDALATMLAVRRDVEGVAVSTLAGMLGISTSYMSQLLAGDKRFSVASDEVVRAAAKVLELPAVICFLLTGKLRHEDFVEPTVSFQDELAVAMRDLANSPEALELAVDRDDLLAMPVPVQHLVAVLFCQVSGRHYITGKKRWPWMTESLLGSLKTKPRSD